MLMASAGMTDLPHQVDVLIGSSDESQADHYRSFSQTLRTTGAASPSHDDTDKLRLPTRRIQSKVTLVFVHSRSGSAKDSRAGQGQGWGARLVTQATGPRQV